MSTEDKRFATQPGHEPGIVMPCDEGDDGRPCSLSFSNTELCRSILLLGSTGAGKTTALRSICHGLIRQNAASPSRKAAMVIFDFKGDQQTIDLLQRLAGEAGRAQDVRVLSLDGDLAYDFFSGYRELGDAQEYVQRLLFGCSSMNDRDVFWDEYRAGMLTTALVVSRVLDMSHDFGRWISAASSWLLARSMSAEFLRAVSDFEKAILVMPPSDRGRPLAEFALATLQDWNEGLDERTRSNVRATLSNTLRPLLDPKVQHLFRASASGHINIAEAIASGQIVVVSIPALQNRSLASLIGKSIKADFYKAVFGRGCDSNQQHRLAMLIADEYHLSATVGGPLFDDAVALPLIRGFGGGMVAATQTLANLDNTIGLGPRNVLIPNFNTALIFRTGEEATADWASGLFGFRTEEITTIEKQRDRESFGGGVWRERTLVRSVRRPICTLSELSRLEPGQVFVHRQFEPSPSGPVWLAETE